MPRVTMARIAEEAGVSKNTVSLALRHDSQIPAVTRKRIEEIAKRLGYQRNPVVAQLMVEMRKVRPAGYRHTLALVNANRDPKAFTRHPTLPPYLKGVRRRAEFHGYRLDEFWLHDPELYGDRFNRILKARGIRGLLIVGLMEENRLPERFAATWAEQACVVTGARTRNPTLSFACSDHHALVIEAVEKALRMGYQKPALVVDEHIDNLVEGRFSAGMWTAQKKLPARRRLPGFYQAEAARENPELFHEWRRIHRPDVILTLYSYVYDWLRAAGLSVPGDMGFIQLEHRASHPEWAGMDQHNDQTGEAAVDMLINMIYNQEFGVPVHPHATFISASWEDGVTVAQQR